MLHDKKDIGMVEDFLFFLQNAVAIEHHATESYVMTKDDKWKKILELVRKNRSRWLFRFTKEKNAQGYCLSKHASACAQGLKEMGNRYLEEGKIDLAKECFDDSQTYELIFMVLNDLDVRR